jgi:uncharacterized membrane protein
MITHKCQVIGNIVALLLAIPALVLIANVFLYAFTGGDFLPDANCIQQTARFVIAWVTLSISIVLIAIFY